MTTLAVTVQNRINNATDNGGSTAVGVQGATAVEARLSWARRWHHTIGSGDVDKFRLSYDNWRGEASNNQAFNTGNAHTITAGTVEFNGIVVPILFNGSRTVTIADGEAQVQSDWIYPSQFSVSKFNRGDTFWTKEHGTVPGPTPATNGKMPTSARQTADFSGCQMFFFPVGQTTLSDVDLPGAFTTTGATRYDRASGACPIVLGTFIGGDKPVRMAKGDSMTQGTGDNTAFKHGRGWFQRAQVDEDGTSNPMASLNWAVHGSAATLATHSAKIWGYDKYCNSMVIYYGTNDFSTGGDSITPANMMIRINNIKNNAITEGVSRFAIHGLGLRTTSTDAWATEANQTVMTNWGLDGPPDVFNKALGSQGFNIVMPNTAVRGTDYYKFLTNGTANYTAYDTTHYSTNGYILTANQNRPLLAQLDPATSSDTVPNAFSFTAATDVAVNTVTTSNTVTLSGTDAAASIGVVGGEYQIAGGSWTSANGTIAPGQTFAVRRTSSASNGTQNSVVLTIGGVSATFNITTVAGSNDTVPNAFTFTPVTGVALGTTQTSNTVTIAGINAAASVVVSGGSYSIDGGSFVTSSGTINSGQTIAVRGVASGSNSTETVVTLTIGGIPGYFNITTIASSDDTTPNSFSFAPATNVAINSVSTSAAATITGINAATPVSITNGEYSINGGAFTSANGTITTGQTIAVRRTSSSSNSSVVTTTVTIGGVSAEYSITTAAATPSDTTPTTFSFTAQTGVSTNTLYTSNVITVSGIDTASPISVAGGEYRINSGQWTSASGNVSNGDQVTVRRTSSGVASTTVSTVLNIGGVSGAFSVTTAEEDNSDTVAVVPTSLKVVGSQYVSMVTLGEVGVVSFNPGRAPILILVNNTGSDLAPIISGSEAHSIVIKGVGTISLGGGYQCDPIPDGGTCAIPLPSISSYLRGTVTITGGTGLKAGLLEY